MYLFLVLLLYLACRAALAISPGKRALGWTSCLSGTLGRGEWRSQLTRAVSALYQAHEKSESASVGSSMCMAWPVQGE
jgi:hypothetical protein